MVGLRNGRRENAIDVRSITQRGIRSFCKWRVFRVEFDEEE